MSKKVIFRSFIFRGGEILCRAAESILAQTYPNFLWYVLDMSGNKQNQEILSRYGDERIIHLDLSSKFDTRTTLPTTYINEILDKYDDEDYFVALDIDDYYKPDFIELMLEFMKTNDLEVASCDSDFVDSKSGEKYAVRTLGTTLTLKNPADYDSYFKYMYQFMRTVWGKMFKLSCLRKCDLTEKKQIYGNDTLFTMEAFKNSKKSGIFAKSLHVYSVSANSVSYIYDSIRNFSDQLLLEEGIKFLKSKCGIVSSTNQDFLYVVYLNAIGDSLKVILSASISDSEKIDSIYDIINNDGTRNMVIMKELGKYANKVRETCETRRKFFLNIIEWLLSLNYVDDNKVVKYCEVGEYSCAVVEYSEGWIHFKKILLEWMIGQNRKAEALEKLRFLKELIPNDTDIVTWERIL